MEYLPSDDMYKRLKNSFVYHAPFADQTTRYEIIRKAGLTMALAIVQMTPPSREQSLSITAIEEAVMRANQAIALNETPQSITAP